MKTESPDCTITGEATMKRTLLRSLISITFALAALSINPYHGLAVEIAPRAGAVSAISGNIT